LQEVDEYYSFVSRNPRSQQQNLIPMNKKTLFRNGLAVASSLLLFAGVAPQAKADGQGSNNGFFWSLWHSGGTANITFGSGGNYGMSWQNVGDVTGGKGWNPGGYRTVGYNCGYWNNGNVFGLYGWTTGPLIEYYVTEIGGQSGTFVGSMSSDGGNYNVYKHQQQNQPSIQGTATFWQYLAGRTSNNSVGQNHTITTGNHFNYWKAHCGQGFGSFNYMILNSEAWGNRTGGSNATCW
jgi:endo-1,4-beta-xylanase